MLLTLGLTLFNCKQVVGDIIKGAQGSYGVSISEINHRAAQFNCNFTFESRVVNAEAHSPAKLLFSLGQGQGRNVWFGQLHDPKCIPHSVGFDE